MAASEGPFSRAPLFVARDVIDLCRCWFWLVGEVAEQGEVRCCCIESLSEEKTVGSVRESKKLERNPAQGRRRSTSASQR